MVAPRLLLQDLNRIGVRFIVGEDHTEPDIPLSPAELLAGLITQSDARLRLSIIAVLLQHPDYAWNAGEALDRLDEAMRPIFMLYYTAAHFLQQIYAGPLQIGLGSYTLIPDYYSEKLNIPASEPVQERLKRLARRHQEITGLELNWHGTYHHAAKRVIGRLEAETSWNMA